MGENIEKCSRCGSKELLLDTGSGEIICASCGYVIKEKVEDTKPEWRAFSKEENEDRSRTGVPTSIAMHDMGLSTVIGQSDRDASGRALVGVSKSTVDRLRIWDSRSQIHEPVDRNLRQAFNELDRLSDKLSVPENIVEKSAYIYRKALEKGLVRGRSIGALIAASLYAACRSLETPRTLKDVAAVSSVKRKDIARCYRLILRELDIKMPIIDPVKNVNRIAAKAGLSERTTRKAIEILKNAIQGRTSAGKDPMGLAAAALYVACVQEGENKTQKDIAEAANVTEVTIRNRYKGLKSALKLSEPAD
ncbi:MAG: transcription initiation factor IIB [Nitrososphaerota archaeon]|nr:transcription initiation factor IIB [Nitrososphaerota archaeon]MDG7043012.1 transcription initiation factor IIB [Nitrososphaerota archaeon]MDG7044404.1 transcription initiation factor IIB [Nitrososphaerota archaeon]MDG7048545.1 transcription initiation factor IIB [Nitrososphaerota archaeon]MDG7051076.1 transcription initiation factor IIB [Nitrososphaerota archaeon]